MANNGFKIEKIDNTTFRLSLFGIWKKENLNHNIEALEKTILIKFKTNSRF